jgi:hypothetical protein
VCPGPSAATHDADPSRSRLLKRIESGGEAGVLCSHDYANQEARLKAGVYKGGKPRIDREAVHSLHRGGKGPTEIAKALVISRMHA